MRCQEDNDNCDNEAQFGAPHQQQSIHTWHIPTALIVNAANSRILLTLHYPVSSPRVRAVHELLKLIPISCVSWSNTTPLLVQLLNTDMVKKCNSILKFEKTLKIPTGLVEHERISWKINKVEGRALPKFKLYQEYLDAST